MNIKVLFIPLTKGRKERREREWERRIGREKRRERDDILYY